MLKKLLIILSFLIFNFVTFANEKILITTNQFVSHPALDNASSGINQALKDRGLMDQIEIKFDNAQGSIINGALISKHQASLSPHFMIAIATPAAQSTIKARNGNSIIAFIAVTDPKAAGLTKSDNIIGVTDRPPIVELLNITHKIFPDIQNIGVIFNPGEVNSVKIIEQLEKEASIKNIKIIKAAVNSSTNVKMAAQKLTKSVDIIYIPQDNLVVSAINSIVQVCSQSKIPIISNDPSLVESGVFLALGTDYFKSGLQLGNMIADIIENNKLEENIQEPTNKELKINHNIARILNINIPPELTVKEKSP